jgi:uncharacterized protein YhaN
MTDRDKERLQRLRKTADDLEAAALRLEKQAENLEKTADNLETAVLNLLNSLFKNKLNVKSN